MKKLFLGLLVFSFVFAGVTNITFAKVKDTNTVGICHHKKHLKTWVYKTIKEKNLDKYLKRGDFLYKGRPDVSDWDMNNWCNINAPK
jgi:phosphodiesterase/alkaline phosphatase D-like protein